MEEKPQGHSQETEKTKQESVIEYSLAFGRREWKNAWLEEDSGVQYLIKRARTGSLNSSTECHALPTYIFIIFSSKKVGDKGIRAEGNGRFCWEA